MKKVVLWTITLLYIVTDIIYENHRNVEDQWGEWKELTLDGARPQKPGTCFYCTYVKPLIDKE